MITTFFNQISKMKRIFNKLLINLSKIILIGWLKYNYSVRYKFIYFILKSQNMLNYGSIKIRKFKKSKNNYSVSTKTNGDKLVFMIIWMMKGKI